MKADPQRGDFQIRYNSAPPHPVSQVHGVLSGRDFPSPIAPVVSYFSSFHPPQQWNSKNMLRIFFKEFHYVIFIIIQLKVFLWLLKIFLKKY